MGFQLGYPSTLADMRAAAFSAEKGMYNRRLSPVEWRTPKKLSVSEIAEQQITEAVDAVQEAQEGVSNA